MNYKVHHAAGVVVSEIVLVKMNVPLLSVTAVIGLMGGVILGMAPDLDKEESALAQYFPFKAISQFLHMLRFEHRGPTHSLLAIILLYLLCAKVLFLPDALIYCFVLSYASHPFLDLFNSAGVKLLFPLRFNFKLLPSMFAVSSDEHSFGQTITFFVLSIVFYFLLIHLVIHALHFMPFLGPWMGNKWDAYVVGALPIKIKDWLFTSI